MSEQLQIFLFIFD